MSSDILQGDLFGTPEKRPRSKRPWTELDLVRAQLARVNKRIARTGGTEKDLLRKSRLEKRLVSRETEAEKKWKKSFGS